MNKRHLDTNEESSKRVKTDEITLDNILDCIDNTWVPDNVYGNYRFIYYKTHKCIVHDLLQDRIVKVFSDAEEFKDEFNNHQRLLGYPNIQEYCILKCGSRNNRKLLYFPYVKNREALNRIYLDELDKKTRVAIYKSLDECLQFLQRNNIRHGDLHVGNVLVDLEPVPKAWLIDFESVSFCEETRDKESMEKYQSYLSDCHTAFLAEVQKYMRLWYSDIHGKI